MAPALTKTIREDQSSLTSPLPFGSDDSVGGAVFSCELETDIRPTEDKDPLMMMMMGLNNSSFSSLESCPPLNVLNTSVNLVSSSYQKTPVQQLFLLRPVSVLFFSENHRGSQQEVAVSPGAHDMFSGTVLEHSSLETHPLEGQGCAQRCWPDGLDVHSPSESIRKIKFHDYIQAGASPVKIALREDAARLGRPAPVAADICRWNSEESVPKEELSRKQQSMQEKSSQSRRLVNANIPSYPSSDLGPQGYDTTDSSSSDSEQVEELDEGRSCHKTTAPSDLSVFSSCEQQWLEERAELASRWSWLQQRLSELERWIRQVEELRKHIRSVKGRVVFDSSKATSEPHSDAESCSPTRMLHNIERQSLLVSSLIPPLNFSPSEQTLNCREKNSVVNGLKSRDVFMPAGVRRRKTGSRRRCWSDVSRGCARSQPLLLYHRRRLFTFSTSCSSSHLMSSSGPLLVSCCGNDSSSSSSPPSGNQSFHPESKKKRPHKPKDVCLSPKRSQHRGEKRSEKRKTYIRRVEDRGMCWISDIINRSLTNVRKLHEILTPGWRLLFTQLMVEKVSDDEEGQAEDLSDEAFAQRHWSLEQREKLRRSSWDKRKGCRRPTSPGVPEKQNVSLNQKEEQKANSLCK